MQRAAYRWIALAVLNCAMLSACQRAGEPSADAAGVSTNSIRTTHPDIALGNLNAQIAGLESRAAVSRLGVEQQAELASLLSGRAQYGGSIADRERALRIADRLVAEQPDHPATLLARARARAGLHLFGDALADVEAATVRGARPAAADPVRAGILQALGRYDDALALRIDAAERRPDVDSLGALASLRAERGEIEEAARLYAAARRSFRDVSPFPLAWLSFDEGLMRMRAGDNAGALALFADAHERLPSFAAAQCHRGEMEASLGHIDRAVALLRPLAESSEDPDAAGQLARILGENGRTAEARTWRDIAAARYDALMQRHPEAYADHAAEFWLAAGADPVRALAYARQNLAVRQTPRAYELVQAAQLATTDSHHGGHRGAQGVPLRHSVSSVVN